MRRFFSREHGRDPLGNKRTSSQRRQQADGHCYWIFPIPTCPHCTHCQNSLKRQTRVGIVFPLENLFGIRYIKLNTTLKKKEKEPWWKEGTKQGHAATGQCIFLFYFGLFFTKSDSHLIYPSPQMPRQIWKFFWLIKVGQNTLQKKETEFGSIQKIKCNHL